MISRVSVAKVVRIVTRISIRAIGNHRSRWIEVEGVVAETTAYRYIISSSGESGDGLLAEVQSHVSITCSDTCICTGLRRKPIEATDKVIEDAV